VIDRHKGLSSGRDGGGPAGGRARQAGFGCEGGSDEEKVKEHDDQSLESVGD